MPHASNGDKIPEKHEAMQYVTYSAKELMYMLNDKVDRIDDKVDQLTVDMAALPAVYVTQESINEARKESSAAKRFAISAAVASVAALGGYVGIVLGL